MFNFIKNLFDKKETKPAYVEVKTVVLPEVNDQELNNIMKEVDEVAAAFNEKREDRHQVLVESVKRLGITHKFRDTTTGEIHEVDASDFETFSEMMSNKNMQMIFC
jgi:hypothetical protein